jgi:1-deoxy-D-xylulose-5-phosphate reductoisomerase
MKRVSILGSTGSIGQSALSVISLHPDRFRVVALAANNQTDLLWEQAERFKPDLVALRELPAAEVLHDRLPQTRVVGGLEGVIEAAVHPDADMVVAGISGFAGLIPTYQAIRAGKDIALANKETLVTAGDLVMPLARRMRINLLPVDSEHCALHQCLRGSRSADVQRLLLTASGGPFFRFSEPELHEVTVKDALNHPTWQMGRKITVDSATLMNKGLEVIEAHHLFGIQGDRISIVVHPQSIIHSMVEFKDGSILAQLSITDMRSPILYALTYPDRWESALPRLDLLDLPPLEFHPPDSRKFPCIRLAYQALEAGGTFPAALNAANEVAVQSFLNGEISFPMIAAVIEHVLGKHHPSEVVDLESVVEADRQSREAAESAIHARHSG